MIDLDNVIARLAPLPTLTEIHGAGRGSMFLDSAAVTKVLQRAAARTERRGDCWWWTGYVRNGYGTLSIHDSPVYLHALAYIIANGPLDDGHEVCHTCDNRPCWSPDHLFQGTHVENIRDMRQKGRGVNPPRVAGERNHKAHLSDLQVAEIRSIATANGGREQRALAAAYGCSQSTIWRYLHGKVRT